MDAVKSVNKYTGRSGTFPWGEDNSIAVTCVVKAECSDGVTLHIRYIHPITHKRVENAWIPRDIFTPAPECLQIECRACGYTGDIDTYLPSLSPTTDCLCPKCGSTNNLHNDEYAANLYKAWNCKHDGTLVDGGKTTDGTPLLKCTDCGSIGLDWSMRGEPRPAPVA